MNANNHPHNAANLVLSRASRNDNDLKNKLSPRQYRKLSNLKQSVIFPTYEQANTLLVKVEVISTPQTNNN